MNCTFCNKTFSTKGSLTLHQTTAKYCLEIQGKKVETLFTCSHCSKEFTLQSTLNEHLSVCKEKKRLDDIEKEKEIKREFEIHQKKVQKKHEKIVKDLEAKIQHKDKENEKQLSETKHHYEEKIADIIAEKDKQIVRLEEMLKVKDKAIMDIAFAKTKILTQNNTNNNIVVNNNYCINLKDVDKLNQVIEERMNKNVIQGGIHGFTNMIKQHYLSSPDGQLGYKCVDTSRQKFEYTDENGEKREDFKADELRQTLAVSNLEQKTRRTAAEAWTKEDGSLDGDMFEKLAVKAHEIIAITEVGDCNTKFRSELAVQVCKK